jgi:hypothetical protein
VAGVCWWAASCFGGKKIRGDSKWDAETVDYQYAAASYEVRVWVVFIAELVAWAVS